MTNNFPNQLTKVLDTNTPRKEGLKNLYMLVAEPSNVLLLSKEEKEAVFGIMLEVAKKLAKVADAVDEFEAVEKNEISKLVGEVAKHGNAELILAEDSSKLEAIAEEALSQSKSALDVAVKLLEPIIGVRLNTFGKSGEGVVKAIRNNSPKELKERAEFLAKMIENEDDWINYLKSRRDDQHYKNIGLSPIRANAKGEFERPVMPGLPNQAAADFLNVLYVNMFTFIMDFFAGAIFIRLPNGLVLTSQGEDLAKTFKLGIDLSKVKDSGKN